MPASTKKPTLHYALRLIAWRPSTCVFPVLYDDKSQPLLKDYLNRASNDPNQIRDWFYFWKKRTGNEPWYGIAPGRSGLVFADIDTKKGKCGAQTYNALERLHGWPETFESSSPSGGRHLWYEGAPLFAVGRGDTNHPDIDFAQYIIGPGSCASMAPAIISPKDDRSLRRPIGSTRWRRRPRVARSTRYRLSNSI